MKYYTLDKLDNFGLTTSIYTPSEFGQWKYGEEKALDNYIELGKMLGITPDDMIRPSQTHTLVVRAVDRTNAGNGVVRLPDEGDCDGLITDVPGLLLCTREADCVPVYMLDPVKKAVGMIHSGWRGTAGEISKNAIELMHSKYGTNPSNLIVAFGPNICQNCYEVGAELIDDFSQNFASDIDLLFKPKADGKYLLDVQKAVVLTLIRAGVRKDNIFPSNICTYENTEFSSYRRQKAYTSHMLTGIMLNK